MTTFQFIDGPQALQAFVQRLAGESRLSVDTEFMRESSYYPKLCLIQIASSTQVACIDPLAIEDLSVLWSLFADPGITKILHAARQDIEVLLTRCPEIPARVFDTQVAAALCGLPPQIGYGDLVQRMLGVQLEKAHARTDWAVRPLSAAQLQYAADDARHLLPLQEVMRGKLQSLGRLGWFEAEMERLSQPTLYRPDPANAWQRLKGLEMLDERRLATAKALSLWRETRAIDRNRPRSWILTDDALREIVDVLPVTLEALSRLKLVPRGVVEKCGTQIVAAVNSAAHLPGGDEPIRHRPKPDPGQQAQLKALGAKVREIAEKLGLSPEVLATRRDLQQLMDGREDAEPLKGWRREVIGEALLGVRAQS